MADLAAVLTALVEGLAAALYPNGTDTASAVGAPCVVFPGWPDGSSLDVDMQRGAVQVSIFPRPGMTRVEGRGLDGWVPLARPPLTMSAAVVLDTVAFAGAGSPNQIAAIVEGDLRSWTTPATGTAEQVAAALATAIAADRPVTLDGTSVRLPGAVDLQVRVVVGGSEALVLRRQAQGLQVTVWAPSPALRSAVGSILDGWLSFATWLALPNRESARLTYDGLTDNDDGRQSRLYRRDIMVTANYPTTTRRTSPAVAVIEIDTTDSTRPDPLVRSVLIT